MPISSITQESISKYGLIGLGIIENGLSMIKYCPLAKIFLLATMAILCKLHIDLV